MRKRERESAIGGFYTVLQTSEKERDKGKSTELSSVEQTARVVYGFTIHIYVKLANKKRKEGFCESEYLDGSFDLR